MAAIRIVHLSDIHFGTSFDNHAWAAVTDHVKLFAPHLIVVTGDLVDHPIVDLLNRAKVELELLAMECSAGLHVVPGNHDVFHYGNYWPRTIRQAGAQALRKRRKAAFDSLFNSAVLGIASSTAVGHDLSTSPGRTSETSSTDSGATANLDKDPRSDTAGGKKSAEGEKGFTPDARSTSPLRTIFQEALATANSRLTRLLAQVGIVNFPKQSPSPEPSRELRPRIVRQIPGLVSCLRCWIPTQPINQLALLPARSAQKTC